MPNAAQVAAWSYSSSANLPSCLRGWFHPRSGALFVARALNMAGKRKDWKPRKRIPRRQIKHVLYYLERHFFTGKKGQLNNASQAWDRIPKATRSRQFIRAAGNLLRAAKLLAGQIRVPDWKHSGNELWGCLESALALTQVASLKEELQRIEMTVRIYDFTGGYGKGISEDVRLACGAACDIEKYVFARDLALRALEEADVR